MAQDWFTVDELRAAGLDPSDMSGWVYPSDVARRRALRPGEDAFDQRLEFHISLLHPFEQDVLRHSRELRETIEARILRLGICRPVVAANSAPRREGFVASLAAMMGLRG